jgi:thiamine biosynthesis lipoprotein
MTTIEEHPLVGIGSDARHSTQPALRAMRAIGTTAIVSVTESNMADKAERVLRDELVAIDRACSRFRPDSELWGLHQANGAPVKVSALLFDAVAVACDVAQRTGGAVDPTVGVAIETLGYDRDFDELDADGTELVEPSQPAPGWWQVELDARLRTVRVPAGTHLDLGASAKAFVADRAAQRIAHALHTGALVSIGGDVATAGGAPEGGWAIGIAADSSSSVNDVDQVVSIDRGAIATSSTSIRTWQRGHRRLHHIIDPATGECVPAHWTLVSISGDSCVDANAASTAAIVWGELAVPKLREFGLPGRLVRHDGLTITVNGWPADDSTRRMPDGSPDDRRLEDLA